MLYNWRVCDVSMATLEAVYNGISMSKICFVFILEYTWIRLHCSSPSSSPPLPIRHHHHHPYQLSKCEHTLSESMMFLASIYNKNYYWKIKQIYGYVLLANKPTNDHTHRNVCVHRSLSQRTFNYRLTIHIKYVYIQIYD